MTRRPDAEQAAMEFDRLFRQVYEDFHRRDGTRRPLSASSRATLNHLAYAGPVTVGEAATHLGRSQSTTSAILDQLEGHGFLERRPDPDNHRRTLVWLTPDGMDALRDTQTVLGLDLLTTAFERLDGTERADILDSLRLLLKGPSS